MASLNNFAVTPGGAVQVVTQQVTIAGQVTSDDGQTIIADYTGAAALEFPQCLNTFTQDQILAMLADGMTAEKILLVKAGVQQP